MSSGALSGKVALVTGASRGIGKSIARSLAVRGAKVALTARGAGPLDVACAELRSAGGTALPFPGDVGDMGFCRELVARVEREVGPVDILVNNAGVGVFRPLLETTPEELEAPLRVPVLAALVLTQACLPGMLARRSGHVVNLTSVGGKLPIGNAAAYTAARSGIVGMTESLQEELRGKGVNVLLVCPGEVATDYFRMNRSTTDDLPRSRRLFPVLTPDQVGEATVAAMLAGRQTLVMPALLALFVRFYQACPGIGRFLMRTL